MLTVIVPEVASAVEVRADCIEYAIVHEGRTLYPDGTGGLTENLERATQLSLAALEVNRRAWQRFGKAFAS
jgi:hypothetical protein